MSKVDICLVRGQLLHFLRDPGQEDSAEACEYFEDGGLLVRDGLIAHAGPWDTTLTAFQSLPAAEQEAAERFDYRGHLVMPGFVDTHIHYPQVGVTGSFGRQLLDWLTDYTFPAEAAFADPAVARHTAEFVISRLLAHGTTTASVFATVHAHSADAFFEAAERHALRMLCGKVMMDRNCPENLRDTADESARDCRNLIERWHGRGRLRYTLTPRFAPTSSPEQLAVAGELFRAWGNLHLQSHLAENAAEIAWVRELFPDRRSYLDVYAHHGLTGPRSIFGHCIHLSDEEREWMAQSQTAAAFCPTSNLFLGSGFFDYAAARAAGVHTGLATDVGGGTSLSMIRTLAEAYRVSQFAGAALPPLRAWYLATLGGAEALGLAEYIGNFAVGKEADFVVLAPANIPELDWRLQRSNSLPETLFALALLGDERCVQATHVLGRRAHQQEG
ncbi:guanine deaminase [Niveibacterium sp. SC-1]|uniref:guanine deaminase n=1 Tax=Niveibacterium sp. SC-1 TaxID=3135646 RepID=UPI0031200A4C